MFGRKKAAVLEFEDTWDLDLDESAQEHDQQDSDLPEYVSVDLNLESRKALKKRLDYLSLIIIAATGIGIANIALSVGVLFYVGAWASKETPVLVELADGQSVRVAPRPGDERSPEAIQEFVAMTLVSLFDWRGMLPPSRPEEIGAPAPDPGMEVGNGRVPTAAWQASFGLSEDFRGSFLQALQAMTPASLFDQSNPGRSQGLLVIRQLSEPVRVESGKWRVDVVANLIMFDGDNVGRAIPFNKSVDVRAIRPPKLPANPTDLQRIIYEARKGGMEIEGMQDLRL